MVLRPGESGRLSSSRAVGAAGARLPDTEKVTGSNPVRPTRSNGIIERRGCLCLWSARRYRSAFLIQGSRVLIDPAEFSADGTTSLRGAKLSRRAPDHDATAGPRGGTRCRSAREGTPMWTECSAYGTMGLPGWLPVTQPNLATGATPDPGSPSFSRERLLTGRSRWHSRASCDSL